MKPAAVSHVLMKIEHKFTSFIELLLKKKKSQNTKFISYIGIRNLHIPKCVAGLEDACSKKHYTDFIQCLVKM